MMTWRFHAFRLHGDGTESPLAWDIPLIGAQITDDLSGPGQLTATLKPDRAAYLDGGKPIFVPWRTAIYAERAGYLQGGFLVVDSSMDSETLSLTCPGFRAYWSGMPHTGVYKGIQADPVAILRNEIIGHLQKHRGGNLGLTMHGATSTPVRVGTQPRDVSFTTKAGENVEFEAGPYVLAWYQTDDLGKEWDDLAKETPFDYTIKHKWKKADTQLVAHELHIGYPDLGTRRTNLRFYAGENIIQNLKFEDTGTDYASEILILGAGEGSAMINATATSTKPARLRRVRVISDKSAQSKKKAQALADAELRLSAGIAQPNEITVRDHPNAPLGTWDVGDEIRVDAYSIPWLGEVSQWVRIVSQTWDTDRDEITMTIQKVGER